MGFLIAIDGVDSSGKQTQTQMLYDRLKADGRQTKLISFPAYDNPSSTLVKMYLEGKFGTNPGDVNAYVASSLFALDRFATYKTDWGKDYDDNTIILADRYVSSNMIHQASKILDTAKKEECLDWIYNYEYNICSLPKPDITIFLDMPVFWAKKLMENRANKIDGTKTLDIHERNTDYLQKSYDNAVFVAKKYNWETVKCANDNGVRTQEDIHNEIYDLVIKRLGEIE